MIIGETIDRLSTTIFVNGIRIDEPVAVITDFMVSLVCIYAYIKLGKLPNRTIVTQLYRYYFLFMGIGTAMGAVVGHAFLYLLGPHWRLVGWLLGMVSITLFERAAIYHAKPIMKPIVGRFFSIPNLVELATFIFLSYYYLNFLFVEIHAAYGLLIVVTIFEGFVYARTKDRGSKIILLAVLSTTTAALLHIFKISFNKWFNYFDMGHIIMAISAYIFYIGIKNTQVHTKKYERS